jgi:hypothetical protein
VLREEGLFSLLVRTLRLSFSPVIEIQRVFFFETDLTQPLPPVPAARIPLEIRPMRAEEVETFVPAFRVEGLDLQEVHRRVARGDACIVALSGSQLAHFQWIAFSPVRIESKGDGLAVTLHLGANEAYAYHAVTPRAWRGLGIYYAVCSFLNHYERAQGCTRHITYVNARNSSSLKTMDRLQRRRTKTIWSIRVLGNRRRFLFGANRKGSPSLSL